LTDICLDVIQEKVSKENCMCCKTSSEQAGWTRWIVSTDEERLKDPS